MAKLVLILAMLLAAFSFGCAEQGEGPVPADENGETTETGDTGDNGNGETPDVMVSTALDYIAPEVGQWIAYGVEGEEGELKLSIVAEEEGSLWYQIEWDGEAVAQLLIDPAVMEQLVAISDEYMNEFVTDPAAFIEANMPQNTANIMENEEYLDNMILFLTGIKKAKINDGSQVILLDMAGVPELVEQMIAENPEMFSEGMDMGPEDTADMEEFIAQVENADFGYGEVDIDGVNCIQFTASHEEEGTIVISVSDDLPILPLMEARVTPNDPEEEGGIVMVTGFGFEGAENLMTAEPDQVFPVAMMLQGFASQASQPQ